MTWGNGIKPGALVVASVVISEPNFSMPGTIHVHAEPDDLGVVVYWDNRTGFPTVRFIRSGTATIVKRDEVWVVGKDPRPTPMRSPKRCTTAWNRGSSRPVVDSVGHSSTVRAFR